MGEKEVRKNNKKNDQKKKSEVVEDSNKNEKQQRKKTIPKKDRNASIDSPKTSINDSTINKENETKTENNDDASSLNSIGVIDHNLAKLISDDDKEKMAENLEKTIEYLKEIGIEDMKVNREKFLVTIPFEYDEFTFLSHIVIAPQWILIKTSIFEIESVSSTTLSVLFSEILKGNFILNSVVYSLDPENKSIWAQADIPITVDFDTFKLNYLSIIFAIDYFMKSISSKVDLELHSTVKKEDFKEPQSQLYI